MTATVSLATFAHLLLAVLIAGMVLAAPFLGALVREEVRWRRLQRERARYWSGPPADPAWLREARDRSGGTWFSLHAE